MVNRYQERIEAIRAALRTSTPHVQRADRALLDSKNFKFGWRA